MMFHKWLALSQGPKLGVPQSRTDTKNTFADSRLFYQVDFGCRSHHLTDHRMEWIQNISDAKVLPTTS
jgi:hypothetical protein